MSEILYRNRHYSGDVVSEEIIFSELSALLPVVPINNFEEALLATCTMEKEGLPGLFLTSETLSPKKLTECYRRLRRTTSTMWIGINWKSTDLKTRTAIANMCSRTSAVWFGDPKVKMTGGGMVIAEVGSIHGAREAWRRQRPNTANFSLFGSISCENASDGKRIAEIAGVAKRHFNTIVIDQTGGEIDLGKEQLSKIRSVIGDHPLAIAGEGITPDIVKKLKSSVDVFILLGDACIHNRVLCRERIRSFKQALKE